MRVNILKAGLFAFLVALSGCGTTVTTVVLTAQTASVWKNDNDHSDAVYCAGVLWKLGTKQGFFPGEPPEIGYARGYDPGTEPAPCWEWSSGVARGLVQFDLSPLNGQSERIISATLEYDSTTEWSVPGVATNEVEDIVASIQIVNAPWGAFDVAAEKIIDVPMWSAIVPGKTIHFSKAINYKLVREWVSGTRPNHGLLFVGRDEATPAKAKALHLATLTNLTLKVQVAVPK